MVSFSLEFRISWLTSQLLASIKTLGHASFCSTRWLGLPPNPIPNFPLLRDTRQPGFTMSSHSRGHLSSPMNISLFAPRRRFGPCQAMGRLASSHALTVAGYHWEGSEFCHRSHSCPSIIRSSLDDGCFEMSFNYAGWDRGEQSTESPDGSDGISWSLGAMDCADRR
jgi:hypothetical protein